MKMKKRGDISGHVFRLVSMGTERMEEHVQSVTRAQLLHGRASGMSRGSARGGYFLNWPHKW